MYLINYQERERVCETSETPQCRFAETEMYSTYEEDSDTDDEEGQKKLIRTSNYLFNSNSSGDEESDSDDSSTNEDEGLELTPECNVDSCKDLCDSFASRIRI